MFTASTSVATSSPAHPAIQAIQATQPPGAPVPPSTTRKPLVLLTVCVAVLAINIDTTIVNVALPTLGRELDASTRDLLWIVDG